jgi:membrane fusion protein (multidrug efflux system)
MRAELPNADGRLLPGQTVRVQLKLGEQPGFLLPQAAVLNGEQGRFVWLMKEGKATPQPVQTGGWQGDQWVIRGGLSGGDRVITDNLLKLHPGAAVAAAAPASATSAASAGAAP